MNFSLDIDKAIETTHYILNKVGHSDFHKLFKIVYFAEQKHLANYGRPITGDEFIAMNNGPVPSFIYDILKGLNRKNNYLILNKNIDAEFEVLNYYVSSKRNAELDYFSESDLECLDISIAENKELSFNELTKKSHDSAWEKAFLNNEMNPIDIADVGGANMEMLKYINSNMEHNYVF